ncbi:MAG TPA: outer membrane beta-barrel protein [bacterium]|nr:outer membrane beta-barrel protein [bacterium]
MNKTIKALALTATVALMGFAPVMADTAAPTVKVDGLVDAYYTYNFTNSANKLQGSGNSGYWYNSVDNSYSLGIAETKITATQGSATGVVELAYVDAANAAGLALPTGTGLGLLQAYASYNTGAWTFTAGRFTTWMGFEVVESESNWNYSHSLLFGYIPVWNQGLSVSLAVDPTLTITGYATNGWNQSVNPASFGAETFGAEIAWVPNSMWKFVINAVDGPGTATGGLGGSTSYDTSVGEFIATYAPTSDWSFALDAEYGMEDLGGANGTDIVSGNAISSNDFWGVALYGKYAIASDWTGSLRLEEMKDEQGVLGIYSDHNGPVEGREATLTLTHAFTPAWTTSLEGRYDYVVENGTVPGAGAGPFAAGSADQLTATLSTGFVF